MSRTAIRCPRPPRGISSVMNARIVSLFISIVLLCLGCSRSLPGSPKRVAERKNRASHQIRMISGCLDAAVFHKPPNESFDFAHVLSQATNSDVSLRWRDRRSEEGEWFRFNPIAHDYDLVSLGRTNIDDTAILFYTPSAVFEAADGTPVYMGMTFGHEIVEIRGDALPPWAPIEFLDSPQN